MSKLLFGVRTGRLSAGEVARRRRIASRHGVCFQQIKDGSTYRSWFSGPNRGEPFDRALSAEVMSEVGAR